MGDIRIVFDNATGTGDFNMIRGGLEIGHDLETAVLISLFTDAAADPDDNMPPGEADPRGWWADTYSASEDASLPTITSDHIGSKWWQVFWRPRNQDTLNWMRDEGVRALAWMITDGVASAIDVQTLFIGSGGVGAVVTIIAPDGARNRYDYAWGGPTDTSFAVDGVIGQMVIGLSAIG